MSDQDLVYYFAYGSNMDPNRLKERGVEFHYPEAANLYDYELKFNKWSKTQGPVANIVPSPGSVVEGVLYQIESIEVLDHYEAYPNHYDRILLTINEKEAWVYVAQPKFIVEGMKPRKEYLNRLLAGKDYLSDEYYKKLERLL